MLQSNQLTRGLLSLEPKARKHSPPPQFAPLPLPLVSGAVDIAATASQKTAILPVSHTGRTEDIVRSVEVAMRYGAKSVAITNPNSPLARLCDVTLGVDVPENMDIFFSQSACRLAHLAIVDLLAISVAKGVEVSNLLERIDKHMTGHHLSDRYTPPTRS